METQMRGVRAEYIAEVWVLEWDSGAIVPPTEEFNGGNEFLGFPNEYEANLAAVETLAEYGDEGQSIRPVRLFPTFYRGEPISECKAAANV